MLQLQHTAARIMSIIKGCVKMADCLPELGQIPLFENIGPDDLPRMLRCLGAVRKKFRRSEFISLEGDRLDQAGVLLRGAVHMIQEDARGNKVLLDSVGGGGPVRRKFHLRGRKRQFRFLSGRVGLRRAVPSSPQGAAHVQQRVRVPPQTD